MHISSFGTFSFIIIFPGSCVGSEIEQLRVSSETWTAKDFGPGKFMRPLGLIVVSFDSSAVIRDPVFSKQGY